jgi:1,4-alpha-glucan branching enzyme
MIKLRRMKKFLLLTCTFLCVLFSFSHAQLLTTAPAFPVDGNGTPLTITVDATKGNKGLQGFAGNVYVHIGIITTANPNPSPWSNVQTSWGTGGALSSNLCTSAGTNKWSFTINNIRTYFQLDAAPGTRILKIAILFRNAAGDIVQRNADGSDMYISVAQPGVLSARITAPPVQPTFVPSPEPTVFTQGTNIDVAAASSTNANLILRLNGTQIASANAATVVNGIVNSSCQQQLTLEATDGVTTARDTLNFFIYPSTYPTGARPAGRKDGITYENSNTEAVLILYAPLKSRVTLVGDFNNWTPTCNSICTKDGDYFWVRLTGLTPGQQYKYQYIVDDEFRFADPYAELILDGNNDGFISNATYPNRPLYPSGKTSGIVGVLTPGEAPFAWSDAGYVRPNKYNLVIYELLMRDFTAAQNWQTLKDTLPYLIRLGFNAIKLMPINEFEGNNSWGYNPFYFFALDKAYGTKQAFKEFINAAHNNGMAVIQDIAFNHATGLSPLAAMWWNSASNQPAANNPYFYQTAQHDFNVFNDFNHNVAPTRIHVERFIEHWLTEYKIDGFRWDLSKGFTTNNTIGNIGAWNAFNQGRIDIWQNYYNKMQSVSAGSYCILEHLGNPDEEAELAKRGMLLWGKMTDQFTANVMGNSGSSDINTAYWKNRSFWSDPFLDDKPGLIAYAESHDEERVMFRTLNEPASVAFGNLNYGLARTEGMAAILMAIPGPKMIWQFGELGYDFSINSNGGRTNPKPVRWDYYQNFNRRRLYEIFAAMANLRKQKPDAFNRTTISGGTNFGTGLWKSVVVDHSSLKMVVVANFHNNQQIQSVTFPNTGTWFDYTNGGTYNVLGAAQNLTLNAGEYRVFLNQNISGGLVTNVRDVLASSTDFKVKIYPNPVQQQATLTYELPKSGQVSLQLINMQGQVVATKNMGFQLKGLQVFEINRQNFGISGLTPGNYVLQVRVDNMVRYEKLLMQQF